MKEKGEDGNMEGQGGNGGGGGDGGSDGEEGNVEGEMGKGAMEREGKEVWKAHGMPGSNEVTFFF